MSTKITKEQEELIKRDLKATVELMVRNSGDYGLIQSLTGSSPFIDQNKYESLYTHATEDMATYYKTFKKTESVLTIGASGEQVVNAISSGAKNIDVYDSNRLCRHALHLRLAAIKALTLEQFLYFYNTFSYNVFKKIAEFLPTEERIYWENIYYTFGGNSAESGHIIDKLLFVYKKLDEELIKKINPYLNPENYEKLKSIIDTVTINYIDSDLYGLPKHIEGKQYDVINLSNIYEYLNYSNDVKFKHARKYHNFVMNDLYPHLTNDGTMLVSYLYAWSDELDKDFAKMYAASGGKVVGTGALNMEDYLKYYLPGLTTQNLAYHYLFETFKEDKIEKIPTEHVQYGQSKDMSHDCALILRKGL